MTNNLIKVDRLNCNFPFCTLLTHKGTCTLVTSFISGYKVQYTIVKLIVFTRNNTLNQFASKQIIVKCMCKCLVYFQEYLFIRKN